MTLLVFMRKYTYFLPFIDNPTPNLYVLQHVPTTGIKSRPKSLGSCFRGARVIFLFRLSEGNLSYLPAFLLDEDAAGRVLNAASLQIKMF